MHRPAQARALRKVVVSGISLSVGFLADFAPSTSVALTPNAASGSTFTGWVGEGCSGTGTCTVSMTQARNVTATFSGYRTQQESETEP